MREDTSFYASNEIKESLNIWDKVVFLYSCQSGKRFIGVYNNKNQADRSCNFLSSGNEKLFYEDITKTNAHKRINEQIIKLKRYLTPTELADLLDN